MCEEQATLPEHIPPRCLFPEQKDLPDGVDLRKQLITVPSCDLHNSKKSKDDEYLLYLLVINLPSNDVAQNQYFTKVKRAIDRNPSLLAQFTKTTVPIGIKNKTTGKVSNSFAFKIDETRLIRIIDHLARGLYFGHFKKKWLGPIKYQAEFLLATVDPNQSEMLNGPISGMAKAADSIFTGAEFCGENPEVFKYQALENIEQCSCMMRLYFYEGCKLLLIYQ